MDSLEALEKILADYKELCDDARDNDIEYQLGNLTSPYHTIKKDLEVLEILKRMIVLETMDDDKREWEQFNLYFNTKGKMKKLELNDEDWNKLKEWING